MENFAKESKTIIGKNMFYLMRIINLYLYFH